MIDLAFIRQRKDFTPVTADDNDISFSEDGDLNTLDGNTRKWQDIIKGLLTPLGSSPVLPLYGSELPRLLAQNFTVDAMNSIGPSIASLLGYLQEVEKSTNLNERIQGIKSLDVRNTTDPRAAKIALSVLLMDGSIVTNTF